MTVRLNPYLNFRGQAREAIEFYRSVFGGEVRSNTFREGGMQVPEAEMDQLMHGHLETPAGFTIMCADVPSSMEFAGGGSFSVSLSGDETEELTRYWTGLTEGAQIIEPLTQAPWGDSFGMLIDRFGVSWMANIASAAEA